MPKNKKKRNSTKQKKKKEKKLMAATTTLKTYPTEVLKKLPLFYFPRSSIGEHVIVYDKKTLLDEFYTIFKFKKVLLSVPSGPKCEVAVSDFGKYSLQKHTKSSTTPLSELLAYFFHEHIHGEVIFHTWHVEDLPSSLAELTADIVEACFIDSRLRIPATEIKRPSTKFSRIRPLFFTEACDQCAWWYSILFYKRTVALALKLSRSEISFFDIQSDFTTQNIPFFFLLRFPKYLLGLKYNDTLAIKKKIHHRILQAMILCDNLSEQIQTMAVKIGSHLRLIWSPKIPLACDTKDPRYNESERDVCQVVTRFFNLDDNSIVQWVVTFSVIYIIYSTYSKKAMCVFDTNTPSTTSGTNPKGIYILVQPDNKLLFLS